MALHKCRDERGGGGEKLDRVLTKSRGVVLSDKRVLEAVVALVQNETERNADQSQFQLIACTSMSHRLLFDRETERTKIIESLTICPLRARVDHEPAKLR